ncbi:WD40-repeat-containing domain protein [Gongronella butleri]|nr:WD40-repeat-containing domain protein [Gongronella butleri]
MVEAEDTSCVYGLRHQARSLTPVASADKSKFLVGSLGAKNNVVCLLEYDDELNTATSMLFDHADEIWDIASCPADEDVLLTCHSPVSTRRAAKQATIWRKHSDDGHSGSLQSLATLDHAAEKARWGRDGLSLISFDKTALYHTQVDASYTSAKSLRTIDASTLFAHDDTSVACVQNVVWNPHSTEVVAVGAQSMGGWDLRSGQSTFLRRDAHASTIRALDYNANKPHHLATGGDDAKVRLWDTRQLNDPLLVLDGHTHWVWSVGFNKFHDQILLSSGSDTSVQLHSVVSVSSAANMDHDTTDSDDEYSMESQSKQQDRLIATYDQHEDSVYAVAWSAADTWTFASLSYAGRVVISQVPTREKFKIMGV